MNNLGTLYKVEIMKILSKKAVWIMFSIGMVFLLLTALSELFFNNHSFPDGSHMSASEYQAVQREKANEISKGPIDDKMLGNMRSTFQSFLAKHEKDMKKNVATDQSSYPGIWFAAEKTGYGDLLNNLINSFGGAQSMNRVMEASADEYYAAKRDSIERSLKADGLGEAEKEYWINKYDSIDKPMKYAYTRSYSLFMDVLFVYIWLGFLLIVLSLSGIFAEEHTHKTDALILSSRNGKNPVCLAKILAGVTVAVAEMILVLGVNLGVLLLAYGSAGWNSPIQNIIVGTPWDLTIGGMVMLLLGLGVLVSILFAIVSMFLSHVLGNGVHVMAIQTGVLIISIFNIPNRFGLLSQIWTIRPTNFLKNFAFQEFRLYPLFGGYLNCFQMAGIVYAVGIVGFVLLTYRLYKKSQIKSR